MLSGGNGGVVRRCKDLLDRVVCHTELAHHRMSYAALYSFAESSKAVSYVGESSREHMSNHLQDYSGQLILAMYCERLKMPVCVLVSSGTM
jgi:hypothetical protein